MFILHDDKFLEAMRPALHATMASLDQKAAGIRTFIILRRTARAAVANVDQHRDAVRYLKRREPHPRPGVTADDVAGFYECLHECEQILKESMAVCEQVGHSLAKVLQWLDEDLSADERYELLNVGAAHRRWAGASVPSCFELVAIHGLEDSAGLDPETRADGPLFRCIFAEVMKWITTTERGRAVSEQAFLDTFGARPAGSTIH